jgi:hypothetical protein
MLAGMYAESCGWAAYAASWGWVCMEAMLLLLTCSFILHQADWLAKVEPFIRERMERYSAGEVRFNLMALCGDRREALRKQVDGCEGGDGRGGGGSQESREAHTRPEHAKQPKAKCIWQFHGTSAYTFLHECPQIAECQQRCEALHGLLEGRSDAGATSSSSRLPTEPEGQRQMLGELQGRIAL